jgi:hypothetical protein
LAKEIRNHFCDFVKKLQDNRANGSTSPPSRKGLPSCPVGHVARLRPIFAGIDSTGNFGANQIFVANLGGMIDSGLVVWLKRISVFTHEDRIEKESQGGTHDKKMSKGHLPRVVYHQVQVKSISSILRTQNRLLKFLVKPR